MAEPLPKVTSHAKSNFTNIGLAQLGGYRYPISAIVSILHRISGALLFLAGIPLLLYALQGSLANENGFQRLSAVLSTWWARVIVLVLVWSLLHHLFAGIRFLLLDLHIGIDLRGAQNSSRVVLIVSLILTALLGLKIFGVF